MEHRSLETKIAVIEEQARWQAQVLHEIRVDAKEIREDVKRLVQFKWKIAGGYATILFFVNVAIELAWRFMK
jgi:hypothetical protein